MTDIKKLIRYSHFRFSAFKLLMIVGVKEEEFPRKNLWGTFRVLFQNCNGRLSNVK